TPEAGFVLGPLLSRTDLTPKDAERAITAAFTWLTPHATTPEAQFVLHPLLSRTDLTPKDAERAITAAFTWLTPHATTPEAGFVLPPLLSRTDLTPKDAERAITAAFTWLTPHATTPEARFVLSPLLKNFPAEQIPAELCRIVDTWIEQHVPEIDFTFLSKWVLRKRLMSEAIFEGLLRWASSDPDNEDLIARLAYSSPQVGPYLRSQENVRRWFNAIRLCFDQVEKHGSSRNAYGVLDMLVTEVADKFRTGIGAAWADDYIQQWLTLPSSMNPSSIYNKAQIVYRCHALILSGRFSKDEAVTIGKRLRQWISHWKEEERYDELVAFIDANILRPPSQKCRYRT
ncbi:hypothetical protein, partial [Actinoallomurus rhizosphaericola]|uniref:hypothetical protein n=1 Tax=Actinoallomurus rhizosphaericola TaxID=2952536 RepID=UPI0020933338